MGTPVGSDAFVQAASEDRLEEERRLWEAIPLVLDVQCGWQILLQCAGPRCHHFLRTVPPSQSARYAQGHDTGMRHAMEAVLGGVPGELVDFSFSPEPHIAFCVFLSTPFELYALNPITLFASFLSKLQFFICFEFFFFRQGVRIEPHVTFRVVFVPPNPKLNPTTNP